MKEIKLLIPESQRQAIIDCCIVKSIRLEFENIKSISNVYAILKSPKTGGFTTQEIFNLGRLFEEYIEYNKNEKI